MPTQKKIDTVTELTEKIGRAKSMVFADYRGLKHKQLEELRKVLKKAQSDLVIAKNRLLLRSLSQAFTLTPRNEQGKPLAQSMDTIEPVLKDTTAVLFAYADEVAPLKELLKYFKNAGFGKTKAGLLGNKVLTNDEVTQLSQLPTREVLLGNLVGRLNAPLSGLHYALSWNINKLVWALNGLKEKKQ